MEPSKQIGRPPKYKPEYAKGIIEYFEDAVVVERIVDDPSGRGGTHTHYETARVPSLLGYAAKIGVHRDTLYEWAKARYPEGHKNAGELKYPIFSDALMRAQAIEESIMFEYGAAGHLSPALVSMYWTNRLGFKNKVESEVNVRTEQPLLGGSVQLEPDDVPGDDIPSEDQSTS